MEVDYEYCPSCQDSINKYCFNSCIICEESCDFCDACDDQYLIILNEEKRYLCDNCCMYHDEQNKYQQIHFKDIAKENKMFKYEVIKVLNIEKVKRTKIGETSLK